jgi:glycine dehydrogenase subunit 1
MHYFPLTPDDRREMLASLGVASVEDLFADIPPEIRFQGTFDIPALSEPEVIERLEGLAGKNLHLKTAPSFLGGGVYRHFIPAAIKHLLLRGEFYTAYTPYQAEVSQGTLQAIFEYQTMICLLTGMEVTNASMYDGATATAEAALMARSVTGRKRILVARSLHPQYRAVLRTYLHLQGLTIEEVPWDQTGRLDLTRVSPQEAACLIAQSPNYFGVVEDASAASAWIHQAGGLFVYAFTEAASLGLLPAPASSDADIVCGEGQSLGMPPSFGGPGLGVFSTKEKYVRRMPGRLVGEARDIEGKRAFVMVLATREQHIRREKATSNICSNQALCALNATIYLSLMGEEGFRQMAEQCYHKAHYLAQQLEKVGGIQPLFRAPFFNELAFAIADDRQSLNDYLLAHGILGGISLGRDYPELPEGILFAATEVNSKEQIDELVRRVAEWRGGAR